jgi:hypothetical protein
MSLGLAGSIQVRTRDSSQLAFFQSSHPKPDIQAGARLPDQFPDSIDNSPSIRGTGIYHLYQVVPDLVDRV